MRKRITSGLTLVEVLLAFLVLLIAVLALLGLMPQAARQGSTSASHARAVYAATQAMEDALRRNTRGDTGSLAAPEVGPSGNVRWYTTSGTQSNTQRLHVEVTWLESNRPLRVELESLIFW